MMIDLAAPKVAVPATIFMAGLVNARVRPYTFLVVPLFTWLVVRFGLKMNTTPADVVVPGVLAGLLTMVPGPASVDPAAVIVIKGLVFLFIFSQLRITFPQYY